MMNSLEMKKKSKSHQRMRGYKKYPTGNSRIAKIKETHWMDSIVQRR